MAGRKRSTPPVARLRLALGVGAAVWLYLLLAGFVTPGETWEMALPIRRMASYAGSLWFVTLVLAPLLACRDPFRHRGAMQVHLVGVLAVIVSTFLAGRPEVRSDAAPIAAAVLSAGLVLWAYWAGRA